MHEPRRPEVAAPYSAPVADFVAADPDAVLGVLTAAHPHDQLDAEQTRAWQGELTVLQKALAGLDGWLFLEFDVPRLGSRIDAVLVVGSAVMPIEFKVGERHFTVNDLNQIWDYALDLKNFHQASHGAPIFPMLVATQAAEADSMWAAPSPDGVWPPRRVTADGIRGAVESALVFVTGPVLDGDAWGRARYQPTPTIVQAARALYAGHTVDAIARNDAGATNLRETTSAIDEIVRRSELNGEKALVLVTGVPGAGKTLVGLNVATNRRDGGAGKAVFLSGNNPLVEVLREALVRDELKRLPTKGRRGDAQQKVKQFIQKVHHFRDDGVRDRQAPPHERIAIFDEAQRAWNLAKTANFMKKRKGVADFDKSEPEFFLSYLDRHQGWAVVICLVGGGQEIHEGEVGIGAWCEAVVRSHQHWRTYVSPALTDSEYAAAAALKGLLGTTQVVEDGRLHLASSMRSFRSEKVSAFVKALLDCDERAAHRLACEIGSRYPMVVTRDLAAAKAWVRERARGNERFGLLASSQAMRLKPHAIDVRVEAKPVHWFLADRHDTRSSYYLEDAATEFQVQGLEVDWACVSWDADLRKASDSWTHHSFHGKVWKNVRSESRRRYSLNAYRVLLTRARQGMAIFVPVGDTDDPTRDPSYYDQTFNYLQRVGIHAVV